MKVRFSYRTEKGNLPNAMTLMETTRKLHEDMKKNVRHDEKLQTISATQSGMIKSKFYSLYVFFFPYIPLQSGSPGINLSRKSAKSKFSHFFLDFFERLFGLIPSLFGFVER